MDKIFLANWLMPSFEENEAASEFIRDFSIKKEVKKATLWVSALGVYVARINGERISYVLAPGWTAYQSRLQYQEYDITSYLTGENTLSVTAAPGWRMDYGFGKTKTTAFINVARAFIFRIPTLLICLLCFPELGVKAAGISMAISNIGIALMSIAFLLHFLIKLKKNNYQVD